ncbi:2'-5' RNA ligase family protein [Acetobacter indonesiensis]
MYLSVGITLPEEARQSLLDLQNHFLDESWIPETFLRLPLCTLGDISDPTILEELDHGLAAVRMNDAATLHPDGFDIFTRRDRITLELRIRSPAIDHLSVKILSAVKRAGVKTARQFSPLTIPVATVTTTPPEDVSAWMQLHHAAPFEEVTISEITLFSSWKNAETTLFVPEADYSFTAF